MIISVGKMKSSADDISDARMQIAVVLSIYEWAIQATKAVITDKRQYHRRHHQRPYAFIREGDIYISMAAKRSKDEQNDGSLYLSNGIQYRVFYI